MQRQARLFRLVRHTDVPGVRGTSDKRGTSDMRGTEVSDVRGAGTLAEGVEWSDGTVAVRWRGRWPSTSSWDGGIEALLAVHGADGRTQVHWFPSATPPVRPLIDPVTPPTAVSADDQLGAVWLPAPSADGLCSRCGQLWPCLSCGP